MKKLLLVLTLLVFTIPIIAQKSQIAIDAKDAALDGVEQVAEKYVTDSNVEKLIDKYSGKVEASIIALAESLQQPAEYVYNILVRQQYVKASIGLFVLLLAIILPWLGTKMWMKNSDSDYDPNNPMGILGIILGIVGLIIMLVFFVAGYSLDILQGFVNPEYGAIKDIVDLIPK